MRYAMVLDQKRCVGCDACAIACKQSNGVGPGAFWSRVIKTEEGVYPSARQKFLPVLCNHCDSPACVSVCPIGATVKRDDGIVAVDSDRCIGCRYCIAACPYEVRHMVLDNSEGYYGDLGLTPYESARYASHVPGTVEKCDFCSARLEEGKQPACVQCCPARARTFGDLDDPESEVARMVAQRPATRLKPEFGTEPQVYYV